MGSPLGPTLANFFMGSLEEKIFVNKFISCPKLYLRYMHIDDVYAIFNNQADSDNFFSILNSQHPDIKFSVEKNDRKKNFKFFRR